MNKKVKVICTYCHETVEVDQYIADMLDETTAFCCGRCLRVDQPL